MHLFVLAMAGIMGAMKNFGHVGHIFPDGEGSGPPVTTNFYVTEDGANFYVAEDGTTFYVTEDS